METRLRNTGAPTLGEYAQHKLRLLVDAAGFQDKLDCCLGLLDALSGPWMARPLDAPPAWRSDLADDHTPFEFSLAFADESELRMLMEPQGTPADLASNWRAGLGLNRRLAAQFGVPLARFDAVRPLFEPQWEGARFSIWHAAICRKDGQPEFKLYLNPACRGPEHALAVTRDALDRLGFSRAWPYLEDVLARHAESAIAYLSLDLSEKADTRLKVYIGHRGVSAAGLERVLAACDPHVFAPGAAAAFCERMTGPAGVYGRRPPLTCHAFTSADDRAPYTVTLHFPIRDYVPHDGVALEAILSVMAEPHRALYRQTVQRYAERGLEQASGLQAYCSIRTQGGKPRVTSYLSAEAYSAQGRPGRRQALEEADPPHRRPLVGA